MVCLSRRYRFKFSKGCLSQILLGPFLNNLTEMYFDMIFRGCSYKGELTRSGGLARLGDISPSLRNFYKNIMLHMRSEPARLGEISLHFAEIPPRRDENFPYQHAQVGQPGEAG